MLREKEHTAQSAILDAVKYGLFAYVACPFATLTAFQFLGRPQCFDVPVKYLMRQVQEKLTLVPNRKQI